MTKILINTCFGGFGLSQEAQELYKTKVNWPEGKSLQVYDIERTDPLLLETVEELGLETAGGDFSELEIVEVPKGSLYRITEYDGNESIETPDSIDWSKA